MKKNTRKQKKAAKPAAKSGKRKKTGSTGRKSKSRVKINAVTAAQIAKGSMLVKGNKYFTVAQAKCQRDYLLRWRERITGQITFLATDNLTRSEKDTEVSSRSKGDWWEQGTDNFDRDFALNRVSLDQDILFEVDEALNRLAVGTYGICDSCSRGIEKARLKAVPYSRMCVKCQSLDENGRKKFKAFEASAVFHNAEKATAESASEDE